MQRELLPADRNAAEISGLGLRRSIFLARGNEKLRLQADSSSSWLFSRKFEKLLYGRESVDIFKFQAGLLIAGSRSEMLIRLAPHSITFTSKPFEGLRLTQSLGIRGGDSPGFTRTIRLTNASSTAMKLRLISLHDPTSLNFRRESDPQGEIGVNGFNRGRHVVMDDVGDTTGVRVLGFKPTPAVIHMTKERQSAAELLSAGEVPEPTAGLSGAIMVLAKHDLELAPMASTEVRIASIYNGERLEDALASFNSSIDGDAEGDPARAEPSFHCNSEPVNFAFSWAKTRLESIELERDTLELLYVLPALRTLRPEHFRHVVETMKQLQRKDGFLPHASDPARPGVLETAHFLTIVCEFLLTQQDRKLSRSLQSTLRRAADSLLSAAANGLIACESSLPQGWRRRLLAGHPSGYISEVNLAASRALREYASFVSFLGRDADSAKYGEAGEKVIAAVREKLTNRENGMLAMNLDRRGVQHKEITIDSAVALGYAPFDRTVASSVVHRLLEKDFDTGYGPRTVPSSNPLYFGSSYADGQLGGYCTRAALGHTLLAYACGYARIGSAELERVSKLVHHDCEGMGGIPGEFPYWLDPDRRVITAAGSDPVAASRFIDAIVYGEMGLSTAAGGATLAPAAGSKLSWFGVQNFHLGSCGSIFVGREGGRVHVATTFQLAATKGAIFAGCERVRGSSPLECLHFFGPGQLLCVGNPSSSAAGTTVTLAVRDKALSRSLFARVEELDPVSGTWSETEKVRLSGKFALTVSVAAGSWKMIRLSQITT